MELLCTTDDSLSGAPSQQGHCLFRSKILRRKALFQLDRTYWLAGQSANSQQIHASDPAHMTSIRQLDSFVSQDTGADLDLYRNRQSFKHDNLGDGHGPWPV